MPERIKALEALAKQKLAAEKATAEAEVTRLRGPPAAAELEGAKHLCSKLCAEYTARYPSRGAGREGLSSAVAGLVKHVDSGAFGKAKTEFARVMEMEGSVEFEPDLSKWLARVDEAAARRKGVRDRQKMKEANAKARSPLEGPGGPDTMYEESGEMFAFLMVHKYERMFQHLRSLGYRTVKDLVTHRGGVGAQPENDDAIFCGLTRMECKRFNAAVRPLMEAFQSGSLSSNWMLRDQYLGGGDIVRKTRKSPATAQGRERVKAGTTMSAPRLGKRPDVDAAARIIGGSVSASRRRKQAPQVFEEEEAEEIRKLYLSIIDDPNWDAVVEDMTRLAHGIKNEIIKADREAAAEAAAAAAEESGAEPESTGGSADDAAPAEEAAEARAQPETEAVATAEAEVERGDVETEEGSTTERALQPGADAQPGDAEAVPTVHYSVGGQLFSFTGDPVICGRHAKCDITFQENDSSVSRIQFIIFHLGNELAIIDSWSFMGTKTLRKYDTIIFNVNITVSEVAPGGGAGRESDAEVKHSVNGARVPLMFKRDECFELAAGTPATVRCLCLLTSAVRLGGQVRLHSAMCHPTLVSPSGLHVRACSVALGNTHRRAGSALRSTPSLVLSATLGRVLYGSAAATVCVYASHSTFYKVKKCADSRVVASRGVMWHVLASM